MLFVVILLVTSCYPSNGAKILGVLVTEFKSHYLNIRNVADELASRGHEVSLVVPSVLPLTPSPSFKHSTYKFPFDKDHLINNFVPKSHNRSFFESAEDNQRWLDYFFITCRALVSHVQQHRDELKKFDLMFCDSPPECGAIVSEILQLPRIDFKPAGFGMRFNLHLSVVSYVPWLFSSNSNQMSFLERLENLFYHTVMSASSWSYHARHDALMVEFGEGGERSFQEAINMAEMTIIMGHFAVEYPQPILPGTKLVGPLTIKPTNALPKDLEQFISGAGDKGIILFSLGTLGDAVLQKNQVDMLAEAFGRLEQRIIWRLKGYIPDDLSSNIKVLSWIPQNDLLAHNSTKAFISHTGHNSLYEAAFYGVPLVCVPIFSDQPSNCVQAQSVGIAIGIDIKTVTGDGIYHAIRRILEEPSFKGNATRISRLLRDNPRTSLQQAADWIEYVHRHKGAKHLRPEVYNLYWYQYYLLDVLVFFLTALFAFRMIRRMLFTGLRLLYKMVTKRAKDEPDLYDMCFTRYRNIGCFNDFHMRQRPLPVRLLPEENSTCLMLRDLKVIMNNETLMKAWNDNMYQFVCRCAKEAKIRRFNYFGVQNCGECWAATGAFMVNVNGLSKQCLTYDAEDCTFDSEVCVGGKNTIYAYSVVPSRFGK